MPRGGVRPGAGAPRGNRNATRPFARMVILTGACFHGHHNACGNLPPHLLGDCACTCHKSKPTPP